MFKFNTSILEQLPVEIIYCICETLSLMDIYCIGFSSCNLYETLEEFFDSESKRKLTFKYSGHSNHKIGDPMYFKSKQGPINYVRLARFGHIELITKSDCPDLCFFEACLNGDERMMEYLYRKVGVLMANSSLYLALKAGKANIVNFMLSKDISISRDAYYEACYAPTPMCYDALCLAYGMPYIDNTLVSAAFKGGHESIIKSLGNIPFNDIHVGNLGMTSAGADTLVYMFNTYNISMIAITHALLNSIKYNNLKAFNLLWPKVDPTLIDFTIALVHAFHSCKTLTKHEIKCVAKHVLASRKGLSREIIEKIAPHVNNKFYLFMICVHLKYDDLIKAYYSTQHNVSISVMRDTFVVLSNLDVCSELYHLMPDHHKHIINSGVHVLRNKKMLSICKFEQVAAGVVINACARYRSASDLERLLDIHKDAIQGNVIFDPESITYRYKVTKLLIERKLITPVDVISAFCNRGYGCLKTFRYALNLSGGNNTFLREYRIVNGNVVSWDGSRTFLFKLSISTIDYFRNILCDYDFYSRISCKTIKR